jgi:uncharacterized damage-inducible protein DinB
MNGRSLCEYNLFIRPAYIDAVLSLPWDEAAKDRGASWGSLKNILLHILEVEDYWFHHVIPGRTREWVDWEFEDVDSAEAVRSTIETIERKTRRFLDEVETTGRERLVHVVHPDRPPMDFSLNDILTHVATEEIHHRGELIALFWQMDREPPAMTYLSWVRQRAGVK